MPSNNSFIGIPTVSPIGVVHPDFLELNVGISSVQLVWPEEATPGQTSVAQIMNISTTGGDIFFPDARSQSIGYSTVLRNTGAFPVNVVRFSSIGVYDPIVTVSPAEAVLLYLTDNSTEGGIWSVIYYGIGVINANAASLQGLGLIALAGTLNTTLSAATSSFDLVDTDARAKLLVWSGGTIACPLPSLSDVAPLGFWFGVTNRGSGTLTLNAVGSETINGSSSLVLIPGDSCLVCAGAPGTSGWFTVGLGQPAGTFNYTILNVSSTGGEVTLSSTDAANIGLLITGALVADLTIIVPATQSIYFTNNQTTGAYAVGMKTAGGTEHVLVQGATEIVSCDGTTVFNAHSVGGGGGGGSGPFLPGSSTSPSITFTTALATGFFNPTTGSVGFTSNSTYAMRFSETGIGFITAAAQAGTRTSLNVLSSDETIALIIALS